jgi:multiple sugar transport system ATP-binding protein
MNEASVRISDLVKTYMDARGRPTFTAVKNISLEINAGEFMVLVGPSGCGKSTTLRMVAGLEDISSGTIEIGGEVVNDLEPKDRGIAMVFQNYALYPHMTIFENLAFGLKIARKDKAFITETINRTAKALGLEKMLDRKPQALSGGQRQRVALGRAIVRNPKVFLFDEPLSNLDAKMRVQMRSEISRLHSDLGSTMIYVTHDQVEAMTMGDRICVMRDGMIMQIADPLTLYRQPANMFVAGFIGSPPMNLIRGTVQRREGGLFFVQSGEASGLELSLKGGLEPLASKYLNKELVLGIRPEHISNEDIDGSSATANLTVQTSEPMGSESLVYFKAGQGSLIARIHGDHIFHLGETVTVRLDLEKGTFFDPATENVIS